MDHAVGVQVVQAGQAFFRHCGNLPFGQDRVQDDISKGAAFHVLHHDPQLALVQEGVEEIHNIRVPRLLHHLDLIHNQIFLGLLGKHHLLDRHQLLRTDTLCRKHTARRALADLD